GGPQPRGDEVSETTDSGKHEADPTSTTSGDRIDLVRGAIDRDLLGIAEFEDPSYEYRRLFSELWGTFLLVLVAAGAGVVGALAIGGDINLAMKVMAPGFMVMAIIYFMGTVSGAHLNPVVTWAFALRGNFPWKRVPGYLIAQLIGALLAALTLEWLFGGIINGASAIGDGIEPWVAMLTEVLLTLGLVSVILGTASGARNIGTNSAIAVGFYIGLAGLWAAPISGASMNTTRSFAPAAIGGDLTSFWVYIVGPFLGATIAVGFEYILRGKATASGRRAAAGLVSPDDPSGR
ncbi:MAG: aquaporin, partial [Actinomycetota bacterium]|nr:aquaporin [Actinomycetota bacterium]